MCNSVLLSYMYLDKVDLKCAGDASAVYKAAVKYCMPHLCEVSAKYMVLDMNLDSLWPVLQLASEIQEPVLKEECGKVMNHVHMHAIVYSVSTKSLWSFEKKLWRTNKLS